jgi:hypothetical protein
VCEELVEVLVAKASSIAKLMCPQDNFEKVLHSLCQLLNIDNCRNYDTLMYVNTIFSVLGKIFEEECTFASKIYLDTGYWWIPRRFIRKVATRLRAVGIYSRELIHFAYKAFSALLRIGVVGYKPKTVFRKLTENIYIAAQPDIYNPDTDTYYEFKLYPVTSTCFARKQAEIFAWVLQKSVTLVGIVIKSNGYVDIEKIVIESPGELKINTDDIKRVAQKELFCLQSMIPFHQYKGKIAVLIDYEEL